MVAKELLAGVASDQLVVGRARWRSPPEYDLFVSYARVDNETGWVSWLFDTIYEDFRGVRSSRPKFSSTH